MTARGPWRCPKCGEVMGPSCGGDPPNFCIRCCADLREAPATLDTAAGSFDSFTAVIDALAAELGVARAWIVRRLIEDIERRIDLDRDVLALLRRLERDSAGPAVDRADPLAGRPHDLRARVPGRRDGRG